MAAIPLEENVYNRGLSQADSRFKLWSSVGLMLSYWCPGSCDCCYVFSGPDAGSDELEMSPELAIAAWQAVIRMAGQQGRVHITGGEPFGDYPRLKKILQLSCEKGLAGLEKIETNAYWCQSESLVTQRLQELRQLGLTKLQISTDIYHQEYVPIERVRLAAAVGREILGEKAVQVRWRDFMAEPVLTDKMSQQQRRLAMIETLAKRPERLIGRAAVKLASLFPSRDYTCFAETDCKRTLMGAKHVHIDGAGNVFSGTCVGIIVGKVDTTASGSLDALWRRFDYRQHPILSILAEKGPTGLIPLAGPLGYKCRAGYADKCHLCYDIRRYLYNNGQYHQYLGPAVCYGNCQKPQADN
jgi:hypothetical protein